MISQFLSEEKVEVPADIRPYGYDEMIGIAFKLVNAADYYEYDADYDLWRDKSDDEAYMRELVAEGEDITVVGVVQPSDDAIAAMLSPGIAYPAALTEHVMEQAASSQIVLEQLADPGTNVLTGNSFGDEEGESGFQLESLFTVDEEALGRAFGLDQSAFEIDLSDSFHMEDGVLDLADMLDSDQMALELPELPKLSMGDIVGSLNLKVSSKGIHQLTNDLFDGYQEYASAHPEADYSKLNEYFLEYLQTPQGQQRIQESIRDIISSGGGLQPDTSVSGGNAGGSVSGGDAGGIPGFGEGFTITPQQIRALVKNIMEGYQEYAAANGLPDPEKMGEHFSAYLQTPQAQQKLSEGIAKAVNVEELQSQIANVLRGYMNTVMNSYSGAIAQALEAQITNAAQQVMSQLGSSVETAMRQAVDRLGDHMKNGFHIDTEAFADAIQINMDEKELAELLQAIMSAQDTSYDGNLKKLGYADFDKPSQIAIYPRDFAAKAEILKILDDYNSRMEAEGNDEKVISYTDLVGTLMSSVTEIIDIISYVLVAFVAISLVVSSIMIGVITYISVLERKKEIGILRAIGASKRNISQVFNAETFIIGLCAGMLGIGLTLLLLIPGNAIIHSLAGTTDINASLPAVYGAVLIILSVLLTLLGGLIPSKKAAKSDPVTALRSE